MPTCHVLISEKQCDKGGCWVSVEPAADVVTIAENETQCLKREENIYVRRNSTILSDYFNATYKPKPHT